MATATPPACPNDRCLLHHLRGDEQHLVRPIVYRRGTILIEQGHPALGCWSICSGWIKVARCESIYARFDFNGDGLISREARVEFNGSLLTDLEVLMGVWGSEPSADTEGWRAQDLLTLLDSADVHLDLTSFGRLERLKIVAPGLPERLISSERRWVTVTVPAGRYLQIVLEGRSGTSRLCAPIGPLEAGQDLWVVPKPC